MYQKQNSYRITSLSVFLDPFPQEGVEISSLNFSAYYDTRKGYQDLYGSYRWSRSMKFAMKQWRAAKQKKKSENRKFVIVSHFFAIINLFAVGTLTMTYIDGEV